MMLPFHKPCIPEHNFILGGGDTRIRGTKQILVRQTPRGYSGFQVTRGDRRIFLGLKFLIPGFVLGRRIWQSIFVCVCGSI